MDGYAARPTELRHGEVRKMVDDLVMVCDGYGCLLMFIFIDVQIL